MRSQRGIRLFLVLFFLTVPCTFMTVLFASTGPVQASDLTTFDFSLTDVDAPNSGVVASGWLSGINLGNDVKYTLSTGSTVFAQDVYDITSGSLTFGSTAYSFISNPNQSSYSTSPLGDFWYDDILIQTGPTLLDIDGLMFGTDSTTSSTGSAPKTEVNIWLNPGQTYYTLYTGTAGDNYPIQYNNDLALSVADPQPTATPEPGTMILMGVGALGMAFMRKRRMKIAS